MGVRRTVARGSPNVAPAAASKGPLSRSSSQDPTAREPATLRFRSLDRYRVEREWKRYEGNALRDLFRELRIRFLRRHPPARAGRAIELGSGPGRFSPFVGDSTHPRVLIDLSLRALESARRHLSQVSTLERESSEFVRGDARQLPIRGGAISQVVLTGNVLGFAGDTALALLERAASLLSEGSSLLLEFVVGDGETSRYLHRLPPTAVRRLLAAPLPAVLPRVDREGFVRVEGHERPGHGFRRFKLSEIESELCSLNLTLEELSAVAPALGHDPARVGSIRTDPKAWEHLLALEERLGAARDRQEEASALLVAARRT
jgi:SAM-dependent methyltransferase